MGAIITVQDWISVQGASDSDFTIQAPDDWFDLSAWSDIAVYVEITEIDNAVIVVQTSPTTDEPLWKTLEDGSSNQAEWSSGSTPPNPFIARWSDAEVPISTLLRWAAAAETNAAWKVTFRIRAMLKNN